MTTAGWLLGLLLLAGGCDDAAPAHDGGVDAAVVMPDLGAAPAPYVTAQLRPHPDSAVSALVDVTWEHAARAVVSFGDDAGYGRQTPSLILGAASGNRTLPIFGLTANAVSHARVTVYSDDGRFADSADLTVMTPPLPAATPSFTVVSNAAGAHGLVQLGLAGFAPPGIAAAAIVDYEGRLMWLRDRPPATTRGLVFERVDNGHHVMYELGRQLAELDLAGTLFHVWNNAHPAGADGHAMVYLPATDRMLLLGEEVHSVDTRPYFDGGVADALAITATVDEVDRDGGVAFHWSAFPQVGYDESLLPDPAVGPPDPTLRAVEHPNAIVVAPDGNLLVSMRVTCSVMKIDRQSGAILWRLGGTRSDFRIIGDPLAGFWHQHDVHYLPNGHLLLLDNGDGHDPPLTRAVEYALDEQAMTATFVSQVGDGLGLYAWAGGSARRLASGDTVMTFATLGVVAQLGAGGEVRWRMQVGSGSGLFVYRGVPLDSLY